MRASFAGHAQSLPDHEMEDQEESSCTLGCTACSGAADDEIYEIYDDGKSDVEIIQDEEVSELVLIPSSEYTREVSDELLLGGLGYTDIFLWCLSSLQREELIIRSPRGKMVGLLVEQSTKMEAKMVSDIAVTLISKASFCITSGYKHKLPSAAHASVWSAFHQLHRSQELKDIWGIFVSAHVPESCRQEVELAYQLILDRLLKKLLHHKADALRQSTASSQFNTVRPLTAIECNAIRYMSAKKYRKPTKHPKLKLKWEQ